TMRCVCALNGLGHSLVAPGSRVLLRPNGLMSRLLRSRLVRRGFLGRLLWRCFLSHKVDAPGAGSSSARMRGGLIKSNSILAQAVLARLVSQHNGAVAQELALE